MRQIVFLTIIYWVRTFFRTSPTFHFILLDLRKDVSNFSIIFDGCHIEMAVSRPGQVWYNKSKS